MASVINRPRASPPPNETPSPTPSVKEWTVMTPTISSAFLASRFPMLAKTAGCSSCWSIRRAITMKLAASMSPAAIAFEAPSHLRVGCFAKTNGAAPRPVATAVTSAKRKTRVTLADTAILQAHVPCSRIHQHRAFGGSEHIGRDAPQPQTLGQPQAPASHGDERLGFAPFPGLLQERHGRVSHGDLHPGTLPQSPLQPLGVLLQLPLRPPQRVVHQAGIRGPPFRIGLRHLRVGADQRPACAEEPPYAHC